MAVAAGGQSWLLLQTALVEVKLVFSGIVVHKEWESCSDGWKQIRRCTVSAETQEQMDEQQKAFLPLNVNVVPLLKEATERTVISVKRQRGGKMILFR